MKMRVLTGLATAVIVLFLFACNQTPDADKIVLKDWKDTVSYVIGVDYGTGLQRQFVDYNPIAFYKGLDHALNGKDIFTDSIRLSIITNINAQIEQRRQENFNQQLAQNKQTGIQFLEQNRTQAGVVQLPSGLQYKVITEGAGNRLPGTADSVVVHYRAMFPDGKLIDETYGRLPTSFRLNKVMKGLSEGIQLMKPGAIYEFYIPSHLGFGDQNFVDSNGNVIVPAGSSLIYRVELINIVR